jgi:hypothetical protein
MERGQRIQQSLRYGGNTLDRAFLEDKAKLSYEMQDMAGLVPSYSGVDEIAIYKTQQKANKISDDQLESFLESNNHKTNQEKTMSSRRSRSSSNESNRSQTTKASNSKTGVKQNQTHHIAMTSPIPEETEDETDAKRSTYSGRTDNLTATSPKIQKGKHLTDNEEASNSSVSGEVLLSKSIVDNQEASKTPLRSEVKETGIGIFSKAAGLFSKPSGEKATPKSNVSTDHSVEIESDPMIIMKKQTELLTLMNAQSIKLSKAISDLENARISEQNMMKEFITSNSKRTLREDTPEMNLLCLKSWLSYLRWEEFNADKTGKTLKAFGTATIDLVTKEQEDRTILWDMFIKKEAVEKVVGKVRKIKDKYPQ